MSRTVAAVRAERDYAHLLLRVIRHYGLIPWGPIARNVNAAINVESETEAAQWQVRVDKWITDQMERQSYGRPALTPEQIRSIAQQDLRREYGAALANRAQDSQTPEEWRAGLAAAAALILDGEL